MRPLGKQGMQASAQGLGCMSLSKGFYHEEKSLGPEEDRMGVIREALSSGLTRSTQQMHTDHTTTKF